MDLLTRLADATTNLAADQEALADEILVVVDLLKASATNDQTVTDAVTKLETVHTAFVASVANLKAAADEVSASGGPADANTQPM